MEMWGLTQDGTAEPASRDQFLRHERGQTGKYSFSLKYSFSSLFS